MKRVDDIWDACPERELVHLANALRRTYWIRILAVVTAVLAVTVVGFTAGYFGNVLVRR